MIQCSGGDKTSECVWKQPERMREGGLKRERRKGRRERGEKGEERDGKRVETEGKGVTERETDRDERS